MVERVQDFTNTGQVSNNKDAEEQQFSHRMKNNARVGIVPAREHLFREQVALFQHILLNIPNEWGLNCASDGEQIHIGGTDSLTPG